MSVFESCLPKRTGTAIYLPEDDEYDSFSCCLWTNKYFNKHRREGLIRLPEGVATRRTIDDYLDPRSPVSIEVLLAEQEEELDHYYGQTDDEGAFIAIKGRRKSSLVSHNNPFFEEEDAQFLSEHRISAMLVERPKLSSTHVSEQENVVDSTNNNQQERLHVVIPVVSTSTSSISGRIFAFKIQSEDGSETAVTTRPISDVINITSSPKELKNTSYHSSIAEHDDNCVLPTHLAVSSTSLSVFPPAQQKTVASMTPSHSTRTSEFPATTLTRTPYQPTPPMQLDIITAPANNFTNNISPFSSLAAAVIVDPSSVPIVSPANKNNVPSATATPFLGRRPSVVQAAQNLLGDKLDDFTEKLAFIKKSIIMSLDSEDEEELSDNNHYYNTATLNNNKSRNHKSLEVYSSHSRDQLNRPQSNGEKTTTWDSFALPKFKKQPSASSSASILQQNKRQQGQQQMRFPRSSSISRNNNDVLLHITREDTSERRETKTSNDYGETSRRNQYQQRRISNGSFFTSPNKNDYNSDDDDEIFDFSKVVAMSKNVRIFGEGVMDNGLRMFNNLSTRIKNANHNEVEFNNK